VIGMREEVDDLIRDIWDELDFAFRKEPAPSKRRRLREWGVAFESRPARKGGSQPVAERLPVLPSPGEATVKQVNCAPNLQSQISNFQSPIFNLHWPRLSSLAQVAVGTEDWKLKDGE
jgi:hypothetical protein